MGDKLCITYYKKIESNAKKRGLEFNIDIDYLYNLYLNQNKKCALTGVDINIVSTSVRVKYHLNTASLDRINSDVGYVIGNVRWLHKSINQLKSDLSDDDLIYMCNLIIKHNPESSQQNINNIEINKKRNTSETKDRMKYANPNKISIIQSDFEGNFIKEWSSINSARDFLGYKSEMGIIGCCKGRQKSSGGFIWNYKNN
jgi:hypothetical protein